MNTDPKNGGAGEKAERKPNVLPATEVARNPNPRANENIRDSSESSKEDAQGSDKGVGSEVTDGEDG